MPQRLLLLTGAFETQLLLPHFRRQAGGREVVQVETREQLEAALSIDGVTTRLLSFCTAVIVPAALLARLPGPSYNIHPGPPSYPGRHPESWGAYHGARRFGATLHEMAPRVDEGAIVDVEWAEIPEGAGQLGVGLEAFRAALRLVGRWGSRLLTESTPLPRSAHRWSGHKTTHAELEAMCQVPATIDAVEFERRRRAFAEQTGSKMTVTLHGRSFLYTAPAPDETPPASQT